MTDPITEAREALKHYAYEGIAYGPSEDKRQVASHIMALADAYALAVLEAAVLPHDHLLAKTQCESCKGWAKLRARIGQGQSPGE